MSLAFGGGGVRMITLRPYRPDDAPALTVHVRLILLLLVIVTLLIARGLT